jgi:hypothetical protein
LAGKCEQYPKNKELDQAEFSERYLSLRSQHGFSIIWKLQPPDQKSLEFQKTSFFKRMDFYESILGPNDPVPDLGNVDVTCRGKISAAHIQKILSAPVPKYIGFAKDRNGVVAGFVIAVGPITIEDNQRIADEAANEFLERTGAKWSFLQYGLVNKYMLLNNRMKRGGLVLFWREVTCVLPEYSLTNQPDLQLAKRLRDGLDAYIRSLNRPAILAVDTPYDEFLPRWKEEGIKVIMRNGDFTDFSVGIKPFP